MQGKKAFEKNPTFLHDKSHRKSRGIGDIVNITKVKYNQTPVGVILN